MIKTMMVIVSMMITMTMMVMNENGDVKKDNELKLK